MGTTAMVGKDATAGLGSGTGGLEARGNHSPGLRYRPAKEFYGGLGWRLDADFSDGDDRAIQFTPPGSQCSIHLATKGSFRFSAGHVPGRLRHPGCPR